MIQETQVRLAGLLTAGLRAVGKLFWHLRPKQTTCSCSDSKSVPSCQLPWAGADSMGPGRVQPTRCLRDRRVTGRQLPSEGGPSSIGWLGPNLARRSKCSLPDAAQDLSQLAEAAELEHRQRWVSGAPGWDRPPGARL